MTSILTIFCCFLCCLSSCAYRWAVRERNLPGSYKQVFIPTFKNYSAEPGVEVDFTNAIREEFERSKVARITDPELAEVEITGEVKNLSYVPGNPIISANTPSMPTGTVLAGSYDIRLGVVITLKRKSDGAILWQSTFENSRNYNAPQVFAAGINTVNPLYNLSARRMNIQIMAKNMMAEAHDRMTENF